MRHIGRAISTLWRRIASTPSFITFGYEDGGFPAPCYPYFFDTEGFPEIRMIGITKPISNNETSTPLNRLIKMAHDRGINFNIGIWDHIYRGGVQGGGTPNANDAVRFIRRHGWSGE